MDRSKLFESPFMDAEVRGFIDAAPRELTYTELERQLRDRFGEDRAWTIDRLRAYCLLTASALRGHRCRFAHDPEVLAFVDDRIGRLSLTDLARACMRRFGPDRAPRRSSLHRYSVYLSQLMRAR